MFTHAITRKPAANFSRGQTTARLGKPDFNRICKQHAAYVDTLNRLGLAVTVLDADSDFPDAYFVEDTAVVIPEAAVITFPGAPSRQGEQRRIEPVLAEFKPLEHIKPPGTVDGGDVLMAGRRFFIGISERTNAEGARQLGAILSSYGYTSRTIAVGKGLHLKSSINFVGKNTLILTPPLRDADIFSGFSKIVLDESEAYAANTLWVNDTLLMPKGFPRARKQLSALKVPIVELDVSEVAKMDGGLTCLSLRW